MLSTMDILDDKYVISFLYPLPQTVPGPVSIPMFQPVRPLPAVQFQVERVNVEHSVPMYAQELVSTVISLNKPSDNLLHHCYSHLCLKVSTAPYSTQKTASPQNWTKFDQ